jgi:uncharacterized protein (DUF1800 family)
MSTRDASIATRRFGLGARPGDLARIASDPRGYILAGLNKLDAALIDDPQPRQPLPLPQQAERRRQRKPPSPQRRR